MKKLILALIVSFASMGAIAQTNEEYVSAVGVNFNTTAADNLVCGRMEAVMRVRGQDVTVFSSSGNSEFDADALVASRKALLPTFKGYIEFPITVNARVGCPSSIDFGNNQPEL